MKDEDIHVTVLVPAGSDRPEHEKVEAVVRAMLEHGLIEKRDFRMIWTSTPTKQH